MAIVCRLVQKAEVTQNLGKYSYNCADRCRLSHRPVLPRSDIGNLVLVHFMRSQPSAANHLAMALTEMPSPSALTSFIESSKPDPVSAGHSHHHALAAQVLHNLQYQHDWSELQIHTHSPISGSVLPKPLVSGLPPHRIYVHPDEQIEMLKQNIQEKDVPSEREWVLSTHLREKWSLRKFAEAFDGVSEVPPLVDNGKGAAKQIGSMEPKKAGSRRGGKRLLLATVGDDSTIVYYIVHDGIVKPRQN